MNFCQKTIWYKILQNFNSLGSVVLEIPAFQYEACHGFRAGAGVHKLFVGGVPLWWPKPTPKFITKFHRCCSFFATHHGTPFRYQWVHIASLRLKIYTVDNDCHSLVGCRHDANPFSDINDLNMTSSVSQPITTLEWDHVTLSLSQRNT